MQVGHCCFLLMNPLNVMCTLSECNMYTSKLELYPLSKNVYPYMFGNYPLQITPPYFDTDHPSYLVTRDFTIHMQDTF